MNGNLPCIRLKAGFTNIWLECPEYTVKKPAKVVALLRDVRLAICPVAVDIVARHNSSRSRKRRRTDRPRRDAASAAIIVPTEWAANPIEALVRSGCMAPATPNRSRCWRCNRDRLSSCATTHLHLDLRYFASAAIPRTIRISTSRPIKPMPQPIPSIPFIIGGLLRKFPEHQHLVCYQRGRNEFVQDTALGAHCELGIPRASM